MAQTDQARKRLADRLEPGEDVVGAIQFMKPGGAAMFAAGGFGGVAGVLGGEAFTRLGRAKTASTEELDPQKQIDLKKAPLGILAFTGSRLFLLPGKLDVVEFPLAETEVSYGDKGRLSWKARTFLVEGPGGRWFAGEAQLLWPRGEGVERFCHELDGALSAAA
jgi:hypothetical protein